MKNAAVIFPPILGALLLDPERIIDVAPTLSFTDFYDNVQKAIYEAIQRLHEERTPD